MSTKALVILHPGFEELEAVAPIDLMARAEIDVTLASALEQLDVKGRSDISIHASVLLSDVDETVLFDAVVLPGGPGINALRNNPSICSLLKRHHDAGKLVAAICAAPLILKDAGIITKGTSYTAFPATKEELPEAKEDSVVSDGNLLTSRGAGTATEFGLGIVEALKGEDLASSIAQSICCPHA